MEKINDITDCPSVSGIYALTCPLTGEVKYIGQSKNIRRRIRSHFRAKDRPYLRLAKWVKKLSHKGITPGIIIFERCENLDEREKYWINKFGLENLYNIQEGGKNVSITTIGGIKMPWGKMQSPAQYMLIRITKAAEDSQSKYLFQKVEDIKKSHDEIRNKGVLAWMLYNIELVNKNESLWNKYLGKLDIEVAENMLSI
jgi:group I intron endonuclease